MAAARALCVLFNIAEYSPHYLHGNSCFEFDEKEVLLLLSHCLLFSCNFEIFRVIFV